MLGQSMEASPIHPVLESDMQIFNVRDILTCLCTKERVPTQVFAVWDTVCESCIQIHSKDTYSIVASWSVWGKNYLWFSFCTVMLSHLGDMLFPVWVKDDIAYVVAPGVEIWGCST
mmetsp:Transcript_95761/g.160980  ORF Transcript_95761/g.160980 Transcript_95761/m.160980 type:complete len:116 (-) Transcript_95761:792-1139(-)